MRLTIIADDASIGKDSQFYSGLDISQLDSTVHAVQWYDTWGEIEYKASISNGIKTKPENTVINSIDQYNWALTAWDNAKAAHDAAIAAKQAELDAIRAEAEASS